MSQLPCRFSLLVEFKVRIGLAEEILRKRKPFSSTMNKPQLRRSEFRTACGFSNRITDTLLSSFLASTSKFTTLLSFISSALIYSRKEEMKHTEERKKKNIPSLPLTVMVPFPAGDLFCNTRGRVSFLLDTT